ncbi:mitochondrial E3 ubiquitin protein ligase 1-like [Periplaneta americana]|uniref:mitochondrial E3 ubiquitin protein ligase 1-like n=1 Tax=Periplaneta americana TaxID=6978 RepID=UPI0037E81972
MDYLGEILALGIDSVFVGICCGCYIKQCNAIKRIQNAAVLDLNPELENIVKTHPDNKIPYVAIRGTVAALGAPITSASNQNVTGTIQKLSVKEHVFTRSSGGFWSDQERTIQEVYNSVPFILQASNASVEVLDALRADVLDLDTIADHFEPSNPSAFGHVWGFFAGIRQRGVQTTEEMLREGTFVNGIGELSVAGNGRDGLKLQPPSDGSPFFLTVLPISSLIRKLEDEKRLYRLLTVIFGGVGLVILGIMTRKWWKERAGRLQEELARREQEATRKKRRKRVRDKDLQESQQCVVCRQNPREIILLRCGHVCLCEDCSEGITDYCPVCRAKIETKAAAYIS